MTSNELTVQPNAVTSEAMTAAAAVGLDRLEIISESVTINDEASYQKGGQILVAIATAKKSWKQGWKERWQDQLAIAKAFLEAFSKSEKAISDRFDQARQKVEGKMRTFQQRDEERRKLVAAKVEQASKEAKASLLLQGRTEEAAMLPVAPMIAKARTKLAAVPQVEEIVVEITDLDKVVRGVATEVIPLYVDMAGRPVPIIEVREAALKELRKTLGESFAPEGVRFTKRLAFRPRSRT